MELVPAPMQAPTRSYAPFSSPDFIYEIKFDGYRGLSRIENGKARLFSKSRHERTTWYPEVAEVLAGLKGGPHILDGEIAVIDAQGRSDFQAMRARSSKQRWYPGAPQCTFLAFDAMMVDGQDVMHLPLLMRKELLAQLLKPVPKHGAIYVGHFDAEASLFERWVMQLKLEGFMAKKKSGPYLPGVRSDLWRKVKRKGAVEPQRFKRNRVY